MFDINEDHYSYFEYVENKVCSYIELKKWDNILMPDKIQWLSNFSNDNEKYLAYLILDKFIYYSDREVKILTKRLLRLLYRKIVADYIKSNNFMCSNESIQKYLDDISIVYTYITGEDPNPCDSGFLMCRHLRDVEIPQEKIIFNDEIYKYIKAGYKYVVFIDDLIGSGTQAVRFWNSQIQMKLYGKISLIELANEFNDVKFFYIAIAGSESGIEKISKEAPGLHVIVAEKFSSNYSFFSKENSCWKDDEELTKAKKLYNEIAKSIGIEQDIRDGFGKLELTIAFSHGIPDNTLPILWWEENGWKPLIRRPK